MENANLPATASDIDPFAAYGASAASASTPFLKFIKGEYRYGVDDDMVPLGTRLVPNMAELRCGFIKWEDGKAVDEKMRLVVDGLPPSREECGDLDRNEWEVDPNGATKDPWALANELPFKDPETDEEFVFTTGSKGGIGALGKLARAYARQRQKRDGQLPVVELGASSYRHKTYGEVHVPVFRIVGWVVEDELIAGTSGAQVDDDLSDEIPF